MSDQEGFGWLPPSVARRMAAEEQRERREAREAERARQAHAEAAQDRAVALYAAQAQARGEDLGAMQLASGRGLGRTVEETLADAVAAADHQDAREGARAKREAGAELAHVEVGHVEVGRSAGRPDGWPSSSYELERMIREAQGLHRDLVAVRARYDYPAAREAARAKSSDGFIERAEDRGQDGRVPMIYR
jgi:hypothetical protein